MIDCVCVHIRFVGTCTNSHVACDVMKERSLYLLKPSSSIWHLMPYLFLFIINLLIGFNKIFEKWPLAFTMYILIAALTEFVVLTLLT